MFENKLSILFLTILNNVNDDKYLNINENKINLPYDLYKLLINWSENGIYGIKNSKDIFKNFNERICYENEVYDDYDCFCDRYWWFKL